MLYRSLTLPLHRAAQTHAVVLVQGPRSAGKTTLLRREFPGHTYVPLDDAADRARARRDPEGFLLRFRGPAIVDDLHRAPELIRYLTERPAPRPLLLASSRRIALPAETLELHPPTTAERRRRPALPLAMLGRFAPAPSPASPAAAPWATRGSFMERDLHELVGVRDQDKFEEFVAAAEARSGQVLDQRALAESCGVSHTTVSRWLAVLGTCFLTLRLCPANVDFGRRLVRSPKLHFLNSDHFESQVVSQIYRNARHSGESPDLRYWRDSNGFEMQLVVQAEEGLVPVAIAQSPGPAELARVRRWMELAGAAHGAVIGLTAPRQKVPPVVRYALDGL